jgi:hypothetical protein
MKCTFDTMSFVDMPLGMFHCPVCGNMVVAGVPHPDWDRLDELLEMENWEAEPQVDQNKKPDSKP